MPIFSTDSRPTLTSSEFFFDRVFELASILTQVGVVQDMERRACSEKPRWAVSETLDLPLVFYMEEDPEEPIFPRWPLPIPPPGFPTFPTPPPPSVPDHPLSAPPTPGVEVHDSLLWVQATLTQTFTASRRRPQPGSQPQATSKSP